MELYLVTNAAKNGKPQRQTIKHARFPRRSLGCATETALASSINPGFCGVREVTSDKPRALHLFKEPSLVSASGPAESLNYLDSSTSPILSCYRHISWLLIRGANNDTILTRWAFCGPCFLLEWSYCFHACTPRMLPSPPSPATRRRQTPPAGLAMLLCEGSNNELPALRHAI